MENMVELYDYNGVIYHLLHFENIADGIMILKFDEHGKTMRGRSIDYLFFCGATC
jgi:hypothetical protein